MLKNALNQPVSHISLGTAALGSCKEKVFFNKIISDQEAIEVVHFALENGINLIDTSPFYGDSERKIGLALKHYGKRENVILSTKVGTHPNLKGYHPDIILKSIENSLNLLQTDYLDIVHIHDPGLEDFEEVLEENGAIELLSELRYQGVIRNIGLGVRDHSLHYKFIESGFANVILPYLDYNVLVQSASALLTEASLKKVDVLLGSPLCMGLLSGKDPRTLTISHFNIKNEVPYELAIEMYDYCNKKDLNLMTINFKFISENVSVRSILTGATSKHELQENINAYETKVNEDDYFEFCRYFSISSPTLILNH